MTELRDKCIRFDWAVSRLLHQKANFGVLEGFLTVFLGESIKIVEVLETKIINSCRTTSSIVWK